MFEKVCLCFGVFVFWCVCVLVFWCFGVFEVLRFRHFGIPEVGNPKHENTQ